MVGIGGPNMTDTISQLVSDETKARRRMTRRLAARWLNEDRHQGFNDWSRAYIAGYLNGREADAETLAQVKRIVSMRPVFSWQR